MKLFFIFLLSILNCQQKNLTPEEQIKWMKDVKKYLFKIPKNLIPRLQKLKKMNLIEKQKPIILPHWVDIKKIQPPFYRELQQLKGKERQMFIDLLDPLIIPLKTAAGEVVGFLPPIIKKIFSSPVVYGFFGFMFVWFIFERVSFLARFNAVKYGYVDKMKDQLAEKARNWAELEKKYVQQKSDDQLQLQFKMNNDLQLKEILRSKIDKCYDLLESHESMLIDKVQEFKGVAESLKYALEQFIFLINKLINNMIEQNFDNEDCYKQKTQQKSFFVSFLDVCSSACIDKKEYTSKKIILNDRNFQWISEKFPSYPLTIVLKLKERVYLDFSIIKTTIDCKIYHMKIYVADVLDQFDGEPSFKYIAESFDIKNEQQQIKLQGIGNIIKLVIFNSKNNSKTNAFNRVGFEIFKIWGQKSPIGISRINNQYLPFQNKENDINKVLIQQGIFNEYDQLGEKFWKENNIQQIDYSTRITLNSLLKKKQELIQNNDFETVKLLTKDLKQVLKIGQQICKLENEIKIQLCREDYQSLHELKQKIEELHAKRDYYDMLYETDVYEQMIIMEDDDDFNTSQYIKQYNQQNQNLQKSIIEEQIFQKENTPKKQTPIKVQPKKIIPQSIKKQKELKIKKKVVVKDDDLWTKGDRDLEKFFKFDSKQQEQVFLKQLQGMKIENKDVEDLFGRKIWGCLNSDSWKLRKKAAEAIFNYIKSDKNGNPSKNIKKYKQKQNLFKGLCQTLLIILNDKIHQIFMIGVDIMDECFGKNICDKKINKQIFTNYLSQIVHLLIERSQVINKKIQVQTINSLLNLFSTNNFNMKILVKEIKKFIQEKDINGECVKKDFEKLPKYKIFALLQIFYNSFSIDPENKYFLDLFEDLVIPCLYHSDMEIKDQTLNLFELIYPYHPEEALNFIENCDDINKFVYEKLDLIIKNINQNLIQQKSDRSIIKEITEEESQERSQLNNSQDEIINTQLNQKYFNKKIKKDNKKLYKYFLKLI